MGVLSVNCLFTDQRHVEESRASSKRMSDTDGVVPVTRLLEGVDRSGCARWIGRAGNSRGMRPGLDGQLCRTVDHGLDEAREGLIPSRMQMMHVEARGAMNGPLNADDGRPERPMHPLLVDLM